VESTYIYTTMSVPSSELGPTSPPEPKRGGTHSPTVEGVHGGGGGGSKFGRLENTMSTQWLAAFPAFDLRHFSTEKRTPAMGGNLNGANFNHFFCRHLKFYLNPGSQNSNFFLR
jgi:hypothetical protein